MKSWILFEVGPPTIVMKMGLWGPFSMALNKWLSLGWIDSAPISYVRGVISPKKNWWLWSAHRKYGCVGPICIYRRRDFGETIIQIPVFFSIQPTNCRFDKSLQNPEKTQKKTSEKIALKIWILFLMPLSSGNHGTDKTVASILKVKPQPCQITW